MDLKYDKISKAMVDILVELKSDRKSIIEEMKRDRAESRREISSLVRALLKSKK